MSKFMSMLVGIALVLFGAVALIKGSQILIPIVFIVIGIFVVIKKPPFNSRDNAESGGNGGDCD